MSYGIRNIAGELRSFPIQNSIDQSPYDSLKDKVKFLELQVSGCQKGFALNETDLATMTRENESHVSLNLTKEQDVVVLPDRATHVKIKYQGIRIIDPGSIYFFFSSHVCDMELAVYVGNRDLAVVAEAYSPHELIKTDKHRPAIGFFNWKIPKPLLSYQSIHVTWRRSPATRSSPADQPTVKITPAEGLTPPRGRAEVSSGSSVQPNS